MELEWKVGMSISFAPDALVQGTHPQWDSWMGQMFWSG